MSKDPINQAADAIDKAVKNVKDTVNEHRHKAAADLEHETRDVAGDEMTTTEKAKSALNEAKHRTQAAYDESKRDIRNST